jgi:hypothetical protein
MDSVYWNEHQLRSDGANISILAIGDSWFWYPFPGGNLLSEVDTLTRQKQHTILAKGNNGAEAFDYVSDFAGFNDLRPLLRDDCSGATSESDCFRTGRGGLTDFLQQVDAHYRTLIGRIYTYTSLDCLILMHSYDYAVPDGRSVFRGGKAWLKPALDDAGVPAALHQACIVYLLNRFHATLVEVCKLDPAHLHVIDSRGVLTPSDWANELHPKGSGFRKIVHQRWLPVLRSFNLA